jgi:hypothetical protein
MKKLKMLGVSAIALFAVMVMVACGGTSTVIRLSVYDGALTAQHTNDDATTVPCVNRGRITQNISSQQLVANGARKVDLNFGLASAVRNYEGFFVRAAAGTSNQQPDDATFKEFEYKTDWYLPIRIMVDIRTYGEDGVLDPDRLSQNTENPPIRVLWQDERTGAFWDVNTVHARGLGTRATGGFNFRHYFNTPAHQDNKDQHAYVLRADTMATFTNMSFFVAGMEAGKYQITFRVAVATMCTDTEPSIHNHFNCFIFNDLASVVRTFEVTA